MSMAEDIDAQGYLCSFLGHKARDSVTVFLAEVFDDGSERVFGRVVCSKAEASPIRDNPWLHGIVIGPDSPHDISHTLDGKPLNGCHPAAHGVRLCTYYLLNRTEFWEEHMKGRVDLTSRRYHSSSAVYGERDFSSTLYPFPWKDFEPLFYKEYADE